MEFQLQSEVESEPPVDQRIVAYRIAQEALTNVRKHAKARSVSVRLGTQEEGILVGISDEGSVSMPKRRRNPAPGHLGLPNMRQRAELAGGLVEDRIVPGSETAVEFWIPGHSGNTSG